jgi:hypothetical protein
MKHLQTLAGLSAAFALTGMAFAGDGGSAATLSEFRLDMPGADTEEYVELAGTPGTSLDGLSFVIIGDGTGGSGVVETAVDLTGQVINANGFFVLAKSTFTLGVADLVDDSMSFENSDNVTYMLVAGFGNAVGDDLDTDDSGDLESLVGSVVDSLSIIENTDVPASGEFYYGSQEIGPDGTFVPGAGRLCPALGGWVISGFDPAAGDDTPGAANYCPIPGDTCADAIAIGVGATAFDTTGLSDSGFHDGSCVSRDGFTDIWYVFTAATDGDHVIDTCGADIDTVLRVFDSADCATAVCLAGNDDACNMSTGAGFASSLTATLVAGQSYLIQIEGWGSGDIGAGTLTITEPSLDNGDDCGQALPAVVGANPFDTTGLNDSGFHDGSCVSRDGFTDIWFVYTAGIDGDHVLDTCGADIDTVLRIFDSADCATAVCLAGNDDACNMSTGAGFASSLTATLVAGQSYLIQIEGWGSGDIGAGTLTITEPSACDGNDDLFTQVFSNGDCASASPLTNGYYTGLTVCQDRLDFYTFAVADGATLDAQIQFDQATADLDMFLYDAATCNSDPADPGCTGSLACGYSASSNETISWTNTTGADAVVTLRVNIWANNSADIATYDMSISGIAASSVSVVCTPPNANSTGGAVTIGASNSGFFNASSGALLTWLNATGGPDGEFGYFLVSATYAEPGVSVADGLLCLTGGIGRYNAEAGNANSLRNSTGTFVASATGGLSVFQCANGLTIGGDATGFNVPDQLPWIAGSSIPAPNIQPGDSFTFQMWYRDGASSNFSDAVSVQF